MDGPTMLNSDDTRLLDYIRKYFFLKPEHYEVSLEWLQIDCDLKLKA